MERRRRSGPLPAVAASRGGPDGAGRVRLSRQRSLADRQPAADVRLEPAGHVDQRRGVRRAAERARRVGRDGVEPLAGLRRHGGAEHHLHLRLRRANEQRGGVQRPLQRHPRPRRVFRDARAGRLPGHRPAHVRRLDVVVDQPLVRRGQQRRRLHPLGELHHHAGARARPRPRLRPHRGLELPDVPQLLSGSGQPRHRLRPIPLPRRRSDPDAHTDPNPDADVHPRRPRRRRRRGPRRRAPRRRRRGRRRSAQRRRGRRPRRPRSPPPRPAWRRATAPTPTGCG